MSGDPPDNLPPGCSSDPFWDEEEPEPRDDFEYDPDDV